MHYDSSSWLDVLFRWEGTVIKTCWKKVMAFIIFNIMANSLSAYLDINFGNAFEHCELVGHSLTFLLVFKANNAYHRFWDGRQSCSLLFAELRDLAILGCTMLKGGLGQHEWNRFQGEDGFTSERSMGVRDDDDRRTTECRVDLVRWTLAIAVAFRMQTRLSHDGYFYGEIDEATKWKLNWDRMRLRTLLSVREFNEIDKFLRVEDTEEESSLLWCTGRGEPQVFHQREAPSHPLGRYLVSMEPECSQVLAILTCMVQWLRFVANEPFGFKERFVPMFDQYNTKIIKFYNKVILTMTTPLPLPFVNMVRTLIVLYLLSTPFFLHRDQGLWANVVMPTMTAMALLGIDEMGTELQNPFGNSVNHLDIQELIMGLEKELMRLLQYVGDSDARNNFIWLPVPKMMQDETEKEFLWYIAMVREVSHLEVPRPRGVGGVRIKHTVPAEDALELALMITK